MGMKALLNKAGFSKRSGTPIYELVYVLVPLLIKISLSKGTKPCSQLYPKFKTCCPMTDRPNVWSKWLETPLRISSVGLAKKRLDIKVIRNHIMLEKDQIAPEFSSVNQDNKVVELSSFKGSMAGARIFADTNYNGIQRSKLTSQFSKIISFYRTARSIIIIPFRRPFFFLIQLVVVLI
jgi:hypothetical protein